MRYIAWIGNIMSLRSRIKELWKRAKQLADVPEFTNTNCKNCDHPWMMHSFYGITRSECHEDECECSYYEAKQSAFSIRKCHWCRFESDALGVLMHEIERHKA